MFGIGGQELFFIIILALILLGPSKLPDLMKTLGKAMGEFQRASNDFQKEIQEAGKIIPEDNASGKAPDDQDKVSQDALKSDASAGAETGNGTAQPQNPEETKG